MKCFSAGVLMSQSKRCIYAQINSRSSLTAVSKICGLGTWIKSSNDVGTRPLSMGLVSQSQDRNKVYSGGGIRRQTSWYMRAFSQLPTLSVAELADNECSPDRPAIEPSTAPKVRERVVDREGSVLEVGDPVPYGSRVMVIDKADRAHMIELRDSAEFQVRVKADQQIAQ